MQELDVNDQVQSIEAVASEVISPLAPTMTLCSYGNKLTREELAQVRTPAGTATHKPIPHITVVEKLIEALSFRQIGVVREEYAVSSSEAQRTVRVRRREGNRGSALRPQTFLQGRQIVRDAYVDARFWIG